MDQARIGAVAAAVPVSGRVLLCDSAGVAVISSMPSIDEARSVPVVRMTESGRHAGTAVVSVVCHRGLLGLRIGQLGSFIGSHCIAKKDPRYESRPDTPGLSVIFFADGSVVPFYTSGRHYTGRVGTPSNHRDGNSFSDWRPSLKGVMQVISRCDVVYDATTCCQECFICPSLHLKPTLGGPRIVACMACGWRVCTSCRPEQCARCGAPPYEVSAERKALVAKLSDKRRALERNRKAALCFG